jgi:hypothetical protein
MMHAVWVRLEKLCDLLFFELCNLNVSFCHHEWTKVPEQLKQINKHVHDIKKICASTGDKYFYPNELEFLAKLHKWIESRSVFFCDALKLETEYFQAQIIAGDIKFVRQCSEFLKTRPSRFVSDFDDSLRRSRDVRGEMLKNMAIEMCKRCLDENFTHVGNNEHLRRILIQLDKKQHQVTFG